MGTSPAPDPGMPARPADASGRRQSHAGAWIGAAATVVAGIIAAFVAFGTDDPPPPPPEPGPTSLAAEIGDAHISIGSPCCQFSVQFTAYGFEGQTLHLETTVVDATTGAQGESGSAPFLIEADTDRANAEISVELGNAYGQYYVIFVLRGPNGMELDRLHTAPFTVS